MEYLIIIGISIICLVILAIIYEVKISTLKKIKELGFSKELNEITNKLPENTVVCEEILKQIGTDYKEITFEYDITPSELINTIICENGYIHSSSIPVYIRELEEQDTNFINEKNYELERQ